MKGSTPRSNVRTAVNGEIICRNDANELRIQHARHETRLSIRREMHGKTPSQVRVEAGKQMALRERFNERSSLHKYLDAQCSKKKTLEQSGLNTYSMESPSRSKSLCFIDPAISPSPNHDFAKNLASISRNAGTRKGQATHPGERKKVMNMSDC